MESVGSHLSRSDFFDPEDVDPGDSGKEVRRRALAATTKDFQDGGGTPQRIRVSAMTELKEFSGKYRDEDWVRKWISKVESAFICGRLGFAKLLMRYRLSTGAPTTD